ncbi:MAG TPA: primosomal protein N' [Acidobacteriota bacterium]|nr:primosomal protein N' [Acidobacteriota bacterium]HQG90328.1 primosomal protein N' [Acidobacteriota bacterium]
MPPATPPPRYAAVALFAPVFQDYTYAIPPAMAAARPGCRVVVPLGGGHANGVITAVADAPPPGVERIRDLLSLVDPEPLIDPPRVELARWISHHYFAPPGDCLRLFFPPGSYVDATFSYRITPAGEARLAAAADKAFQDKLLALIRRSPGIDRKEIGRVMPARFLDRVLANLERNGWVARESRVLGARTGFRRVLFVELADPAADPAAYPKRQRAVIEFLRSHQGPLPLARVVAETGVPHDVMRRLQAKGVLRIEAAESYRDPFAGYRARETEALVLTAAQRAAVDRIRGDLDAGRPGQYLVLGVTGSGKTQVYIELIHDTLRRGRTALMLVPEISLTPALTQRFMTHFGGRLAILHSMLSDGERHDQWFRIHRGEADVVIGTRSALFAPLAAPGVIILDEEHDASYKQDESPRYHAREAARAWARQCGAALVLGSATPSLESYHAATEAGAMTLLELPERILNRPLPDVAIVDMVREFERFGRNVIVAGEIYKAIADRMHRGEQVMVLLNRRGFAPVVTCRKCGETVLCAHCDIAMTFHQAERQLMCHYCGFLRPVPDTCPACGSGHLFLLGLGTEKLVEVFRERFPGRRVVRFDRDTTRQKGSMKEILDRFERREIDLLVGTQMIAKGHDFPAVTLVVVLSTDTSLRIPDFRSAERTFQLLTQVAGRSGRGDTPGRVFIQTYYPNHYAVRLARQQDYPAFYRQEMEFRRRLHFPPVARLVFLAVKDKRREKAEAIARAAGEHLRAAIAERGLATALRVQGPVPALLEKIKDDFRWSLLVRCLSTDGLPEVLLDFRRRCLDARLPFAQIAVDVDPLDLL